MIQDRMLVPYACFSSLQSFSENDLRNPYSKKIHRGLGEFGDSPNRLLLLSDVLELWKADCVYVGGTVKANEGQKKS